MELGEHLAAGGLALLRLHGVSFYGRRAAVDAHPESHGMAPTGDEFVRHEGSYLDRRVRR
jgi:hypothetical protein